MWEEGPTSFQPNDAMLKAAVCPLSARRCQLRSAFQCSSRTPSIVWRDLFACMTNYTSYGLQACFLKLADLCDYQLQVDAGLDKDLVMGDPKAPRFVFWNKKLRPTPSGPDVVTFDLLSIWGKLRAGLGAAGLRKAPPGEHMVVR